MDSNRAAAKAAPCKILLRITVNLMSAFSQPESRHGASQRTSTQRFIFRAARGIPDLLLFVHAAFVNLGRYVNQPKRCSADLWLSCVDKPDTSYARTFSRRCGVCSSEVALSKLIRGAFR